MYCYLMQHGEAKTESEDSARSLSERGREEVRLVALHAAAAGVQVAEILHSGKLRALQTAKILADYLRPPRGTREIEGLGPNDDPKKARADLAAASEPLMIVGHLPHLSHLASALILGEPKTDLIRFRTGAMVCLARTEGAFRLEWLLTPELAGALELSTGSGGDG
jgi:phosphohistidine phosphatase